MKYVIGIDEVGRGPIAGPLVVCACAVLEGVDVLTFFPKGVLKDSKKLSEKYRIKIVDNIKVLVESKKIVYGIGEIDANEIDEEGLRSSIRKAIDIALTKVHKKHVDERSFIYLDGSLSADKKYPQETIIKGDEKVPSIALASIIAKVYRDTLMKKFGEELPHYGFSDHVGYGTKAHYEAIEKHGISRYHRKSFLKNIVK